MSSTVANTHSQKKGSHHKKGSHESAEPTKTVVEDCVDAGRETIDNAYEAAAPKVSAAKDAAYSAAESAKAQAEETTAAGRAAVDGAKEKLNSGAEVVREKVASLVESGKEAVNSAAQSANGLLHPDVAGYTEKVKETVGQYVEGAKNNQYVQGTVNKIQSVKDTVTQETAAYTDAGKQAIADAKDSISKASENIHSAVAQRRESIGEYVGNVKKSVSEIRENAVENAHRTIESTKDGLKRNVDHYVESGKNTVEGVKTRVAPIIDNGKERFSDAVEPVVVRIKSYKLNESPVYAFIVKVLGFWLYVALALNNYANTFTRVTETKKKILESTVFAALVSVATFTRSAIFSIPKIGPALEEGSQIVIYDITANAEGTAKQADSKKVE